MGPALILEPGPSPLALDDALDGLDASQLRLAAAGYLQLPALTLRIHRVHPEEVGGKKHGLLAAYAAADLHHHVLPIVGVPGQQQDLQFLPQPLHLRLGLLELLLGHFLHFRVPQQLLGGVPVRLRLPVGPVGQNHRLQLLLLLGQPAQQVRIAVGGGVLHLADDGLHPVRYGLQFIQHCPLSPFPRPGCWSGTRPARRWSPPCWAGWSRRTPWVHGHTCPSGQRPPRSGPRCCG